MHLNKSTLFVIAAVALVVAGVIALAVMPTKTLEVPSEGKYQFVIDQPMQRVRKILVRTNAIKKIVAMANAELLDQKWLDMQFEIEGPLLKADWKLDGHGELIVKTNNAYIGQHEITLNQKVDITPDRLHATNELARPNGPIREYTSILTLTPDPAGNAEINSSLHLKIRTSASWLTSSRVESEIRKAALESLKNQEQALRAVVAEHADELIILPQKNDRQ